jgi:hypothetical protein
MLRHSKIFIVQPAIMTRYWEPRRLIEKHVKKLSRKLGLLFYQAFLHPDNDRDLGGI